MKEDIKAKDLDLISCSNDAKRNSDDEISGLKVMEKFGRFQIMSIVMLCPAFFSVGTMLLSLVFINIEPKYECRSQTANVSKLSIHNSSEPANLDHCKSFIRNDNGFENIPHDQLLKNSTNRSFAENNSKDNRLTRECLEGWNYNYSMGNTVVSEFNLICKSAWKRPLTLSSVMFGMLIGSLSGGYMADRYGRKKTSLTAFVGHFIAAIILSFSPNYEFYIIFLILLGINNVVVYNTAFVWTQELVHSGDKRSLASFCTSTSFSLGGMASSLTAYCAQDWQWIYRVVGVACLIYFPIMWFVPETPSWLLQKGRINDANNVLRKIAKLNKMSTAKKSSVFKISKAEQIKKVNAGPISNKYSSFTLLWKNSTLRRRLLITCFVWNVTFLGYYTMSFNSANIGGDVYINNLLGGIFDIGSSICIIAMLKKISRKKTLAILLLAFAFFCVTTPTIREKSTEAGTAFALIGRFFSTACMWLSILFTGEYFPTLLRNTSIGIASMSARIFCLLFPFLIFAGENFDLSIPFYAMSVLSVLGCFLVMMLPETSKTSLPDTLEDALDLQDRKCLDGLSKCRRNFKKKFCNNGTIDIGEC